MSRGVDVEAVVPAETPGRFMVRIGGRRYDVGLSDEEAEALAPGTEPEQLVRESFLFLLERESPGSILQRFQLPVIARYFPDYPAEIRRRLASR